MRDPKRIQEMLSLIEEIWQRNPDLRFNQLLYSLQYDYSQKHDGMGLVQEVEADGFTRTGFDLFNLEDSAFIEYLHSVIANLNNNLKQITRGSIRN